MNPYKEKIKTSQILAKTWDQLEKIGGQYSIDYLYPYDRLIVIFIGCLDQLHDARQLIRKVFPQFRGDLKTIWAANSYAIASWEDKKIKEVEIWLSVPIDKFPAELIKDGCGFKETISRSHEYSCNLD